MLKGELKRELTVRELEIIDVLASNGATNKEIAKQLGISHDTVGRHIYNICNKLGVDSRLQIALYAKDRLCSLDTTDGA